MRRMLLAALAVAIFLSSGILLQRSAIKAHPPVPGTDAKATDAGFFQLAANVCGAGGCVAVQVKRLDKHQLHKTMPAQTTPQTQHGLPGSIS
jgi:hypothetical protein